MVVGMASFFTSFGSFQPPKYFWCCFVGIPLMGVGLAITKFAYMGAVFRYISAESAPVAKDTINYMAVETRDAVRHVAGAVREGFAGERKVRCSNCGVENDAEARFCDQCGSKVLTDRRCHECGASNDANARYCDDCGSSLG